MSTPSLEQTGVTLNAPAIIMAGALQDSMIFLEKKAVSMIFSYK